MNKLERLDTLPPEIISNFLSTGKSDAIDTEMQMFVKQLQWSIEIWEHNRSITAAAKKLRNRVMAVQKIKMPMRLAKERVSDAINYFHVDLGVEQKIFDLQAADDLSKIVQLMIADDKLDAAARNIIKANELRHKANKSISTSNYEAPRFLISPDVSLVDIGFEKENLKSIAKKDSNGYYLDLINNLDVDKEDKKRLLKDADIHDVPFEELENNGD